MIGSEPMTSPTKISPGGISPTRLISGTQMNASFMEAFDRIERNSAETVLRRQARLAYEQCPGTLLGDRLLTFPEVLSSRLKRKRLHEPKGLVTAFRIQAEALSCVVRRYVLSDEVAAAAMAVAQTRSSAIEQSLDLVRLPISPVWIEWNDRERIDLARIAGLEPRPGAAFPERVGLLVESDPSGRAGTMAMAYVLPGEGPTVTPHILRFDLDDPGFMDRALAARLNDPGLRVGFSDIQKTPKFSRRLFTPYVAFDLQPDLPSLARATADINRVLTQPEEVLDDHDRMTRAMTLRGLGELLDEWPFLLAVLLMLGSVNGVEEEAATRAPIVLPRQMRRQQDHVSAERMARRISKPVEHVQVTLRLSQHGQRSEADCLHEASGRKSPRLHWVTGHFRRRGDKVFWCSPHMRGDRSQPMAARTTVKVEM